MLQKKSIVLVRLSSFSNFFSSCIFEFYFDEGAWTGILYPYTDKRGLALIHGRNIGFCDYPTPRHPARPAPREVLCFPSSREERDV